MLDARQIVLSFGVFIFVVCTLGETADRFTFERERAATEFLREKKLQEKKLEDARKEYVREQKQHVRMGSDASRRATLREQKALQRLELGEREQQQFALEKRHSNQKSKDWQKKDLFSLGLLEDRDRVPIEKRNLLGKKGDVSRSAPTTALPPPVTGSESLPPLPGAENANQVPPIPQAPAFDNGPSQPLPPYTPPDPYGGGAPNPYQNNDAIPPYNPNDPGYIPPAPIDDFPPPYFDEDY